MTSPGADAILFAQVAVVTVLPSFGATHRTLKTQVAGPSNSHFGDTKKRGFNPAIMGGRRCRYWYVMDGWKGEKGRGVSVALVNFWLWFWFWLERRYQTNFCQKL